MSQAEKYTEKNAGIAELCFIVLAAVFIMVACFFIWLSFVQSKRKKAFQKAEYENRKKSEHLSQMAKELQAPMDEISELIYIADMENYDLLYINEAGKKDFHLDDITGKKCYIALQGKESPCEDCINGQLKPGENFTWETTNPLTKRHYMLKDRLIEWNGRKARLEIAFDMTEAENEKQKLKYALDIENMVVECIQILYQGRDLGKDLGQVLGLLGHFLQAERAYIMQLRDGFFYNDFEWCAQGVEPQKENLQGISLSIFKRWLPILEKQKCMVIEDLEEYRETDPEEYQALSIQGIRSLVVAPLEKDGVIVGCLGVDNPPIEKLWNIGSPLQTLCYFLLLSYRRSENERQLFHMSFHDTLTSFYNRNRFMKDLISMEGKQSSVGIVYLDVNGLKEINDKLGHAMGDSILIKAADIIRSVFSQSDCYRIGGDEFVVICVDLSEEKFDEKVTELKKYFEKDRQCRAAIGGRWAKAVENISKIVSEADARMYEEKKEFYKKQESQC